MDICRAPRKFVLFPPIHLQGEQEKPSKTHKSKWWSSQLIAPEIRDPMVEDVSHGPNKRQKFVGDGMEEESPEEKASRRLAELIVSSSAKDDDTLCQMVRGAGLKGSVIEGVGEAALEGMLARMREIKAADLRPGLLLAGQMIVRWSATEGVGEKQLGFLRRKSGIAVFSGFLRHLTKAEAQLQDIIQEDLL
eukprot:2017767-Rhodomonas_salina.1